LDKIVKISTQDLSLQDFIDVARHGARVELCDDAKCAIEASRAAVDKMVANEEIVYGITTGFGSLAKVAINPDQVHDLQKNLIISHACGVGNPLPVEVVRGMLLLRAKSLSKGYSGIRPVVINTMLEMLNKNVTPVVPEKGSLGASGDLCPLSHMVLPMLGVEGSLAYFGDEKDPICGIMAMERAGIAIVEHLEAKEGLALNNGTQCMTSIGALAVYDAQNLLETAEKAAGLTLEALNGRTDAFYEGIHKLRNQTGQQTSAQKMLEHTKGSSFINTSKPDKNNPELEIRLQDAYALRCIPQVHGASRDAIGYVTQIIEREINAVTDNPLIFLRGEARAISGGNFHGQPIALAMDFLSIAIAELANISERRLERLVNDSLSNGLPAYLAAESGVHSGFMIVQYSAAALVSENKTLAHPASVDSIPSSNNQEDHVSMVTIAARKAANILENAQQVIAMELLSAAQAIDLRKKNADWRKKGSDKPGWIGSAPSNLGATSQKVYDMIRQNVTAMWEDRYIAPDMAAVAALVKNNSF